MKTRSRFLREKMFFFPGSRNRNLLGFLHYADLISGSTGLLYCHPFAEEKNMSHAVVTRASRVFAAEGFPVMRFDFSGCGDSQGDLRSMTVEDWLKDIDAAAKVLKKELGVSRVLFWGLRMGASLALLSAADRNDVAGFVLWQPVFDLSIHIRQFLRHIITSEISRAEQFTTKIAPEKELLRRGLVYVMGYPITAELYTSLVKRGSEPAKVVPPTPLLVLSISTMDQPAIAMKSYVENFKNKGAMVTMHHVVAEPFWDRYWQWECSKALDITLQWLRSFV